MSVHGWAAIEVGEVVERASGSWTATRKFARDCAVHRESLDVSLRQWPHRRRRKDFRRLFIIARDLDSAEVLLQAHHTAWPVRWSRGRLTDAVEHIDAGLALYDEERHAHHRFRYLGHDPAVCGLAIASQLYSALGYPTRAKDHGDQALTLARRLSHEPSIVHGLWFVVESQTTRRDIAGVTANTAELLALAERHGLPLPRAMGLVYRGWALASSGYVADGLELAGARRRFARAVRDAIRSIACLRSDRRNPLDRRTICPKVWAGTKGTSCLVRAGRIVLSAPAAPDLSEAGTGIWPN